MNTAALKTFAPAVRRQLMEAVTRKLDFALSAKTPDFLTTYAPQVAALRKLEKADRAGLIERVAYTWFNRLAALRFMDARDWHPFRSRVLTSASPGETQPELLKLMSTGALPQELQEHTNVQRLNDLLDGKIPSSDAQGEVYRSVVLAACHFYHALLPDIFEKLDDETELLLPDDLLTEQSIVHGFRTEISDEDCSEVEILGWLYQFYISEKKDQVMARKAAVPTKDIPAVTQLFTPHWIVRYLVENSLGRLWLQSRPQSRLREHMPYYIEDPAPEPPAWEPDWKDKGICNREGDCEKFMWLRPNPKTQGRLEDAGWYALTIDGYAYTKSVWGLDALRGEASAKLEEIEKNGWASASFSDLRGCLFILQRQHKWSEGGYTGDIEARFKACHDALCTAWDREWRKHEKELPNLSAFGIQSQGSPVSPLTVEKPENIRLLDPASGSGHMLTYAFDLLSFIYDEEGYAPSEIPGLILRHNLYGLEICPRAAQLAELALVFKAREKSRRFFQPEHCVRPHIIELREVSFAENELRDYIHALGLGDLFKQPMLKLLHQFEEAKNFGSLIQPCFDEQAIVSARGAIVAKDLGGQLFLRETHFKVLRVLKQAEALTRRYHVVVANPPYMGGGLLNASLKSLALDTYPKSKADLFAMFIERCLLLVVEQGYVGMITMQTWMFISSFEKLREQLLSASSVRTMAHLGARAFSSISGEIVQTTAFILTNGGAPERNGVYFRLTDYNSEIEKDKALLERKNLFYATPNQIARIPGRPFAYWVSNRVRELFATERLLGEIAPPRKGMITSDNKRFLRVWTEVGLDRVGFGIQSRKQAKTSGRKWFPYNKGGEARKWFGNREYLVNWEDDGAEVIGYNAELYGSASRQIQNTDFYFLPSVSWSWVSSSIFGARYYDAGFIFDTAGPSISAKYEVQLHVLALLTTPLAVDFVAALNPTLNFVIGTLSQVPVVKLPKEVERLVAVIAEEAINISRQDWDNFETSWDFCDLPLLRSGLKGVTLEASWRNWEYHCQAAIRRMQELEMENNRLFITAYGLQDELKPEVPEEQITLARAEARRDMIAFLSYAVGCMMGRYSLDKRGLILANAGDTVKEYEAKVSRPLDKLTFTPDEDGIIPVLDGEWFEDDIVACTRDFLRAIYGEATLKENIRFIEDSLGKDLRKYFLNDFYKDHLQTYKKRPIYWLVQSPKKGFAVLIYLHRYTRDTLNLVLNRYLRDYQAKLRNRLSHVTELQVTAATAKAKTEARKEVEKVTKILAECDEWERQTMLPLAQARIELDLDDGVKTNYLKLGEALAPIAGLAAKEDE